MATEELVVAVTCQIKTNVPINGHNHYTKHCQYCHPQKVQQQAQCFQCQEIGHIAVQYQGKWKNEVFPVINVHINGKQCMTMVDLLYIVILFWTNPYAYKKS